MSGPALRSAVCCVCVSLQAQEVKQRGNGLFKQGKLEEAAQCYEEAIQLGAGDVTLVASCHQNLAAVHDELVSPSIYSFD